jgi:hypothetical protein
MRLAIIQAAIRRIPISVVSVQYQVMSGGICGGKRRGRIPPP